MTLLLFSVFSIASPLSEQASGFFSTSNGPLYLGQQISNFNHEFLQVVSKIPDNQSVLIQYEMPTLAANRIPAGSMPSGMTGMPIGTNYSSIAKDVTGWWVTQDWFSPSMKPDWVVTNPYSWSYYSTYFTQNPPMSSWADYFYNLSQFGPQTLSNQSQFAHYGVFADIHGALIFKKGYQGPLDYSSPYDWEFVPSGGYLYTNQYAYHFDVNSPNATIGRHQLVVSNLKGQTGWYGPYVYVPPGKFEITFELSTSNLNASNNAILAIHSGYGRYSYASLPISGKRFHSTNKIQDFTLNVTFDRPILHAEFIVPSIYWNGSLTLHSVFVNQTYGPNLSKFNTSKFSHADNMRISVASEILIAATNIANEE